MSLSVYLVGSLRNSKIPLIGKTLRSDGHDVFDDWFGAGPQADDFWKDYEAIRGRSYLDAIRGHAAQCIFNFDMSHIKRCDAGVICLPAGRSAHLELGYMLGRGKLGYVLFEEEPEKDRWDVMYQMATGVFFDVAPLRIELNARALEQQRGG